LLVHGSLIFFIAYAKSVLQHFFLLSVGVLYKYYQLVILHLHLQSIIFFTAFYFSACTPIKVLFMHIFFDFGFIEVLA